MNDPEHRKRLVERLAAAAKEFRSACLAVKDPYTPIEAGGWNVHQVAVHPRDVDKLVYALRARQTLAEVNPAIANFDSEACMAVHYDPMEPLSDLLDGFISSVGSLAEILDGVPGDAWTRSSSHERDGGVVSSADLGGTRPGAYWGTFRNGQERKLKALRLDFAAYQSVRPSVDAIQIRKAW